MRCHRLISLFLAGLLQLAVPVLASTYSTSVIGHDLNSNQVASVQTIVEAMQIELGRTTAPPPIYTPVTYAGTAGSTNTYPVLTNFYDPNNFAIGLASVTATNGTAWIDSSGTNLGYYNTNAITNSVAVVVTNWYGSAVTGQVVVANNLSTNPIPLIPFMTSLTTPSGIVSASSTTAPDYAWTAFNTNSPGWGSGSDGSPFIQYTFPSSKTITNVTGAFSVHGTGLLSEFTAHVTAQLAYSPDGTNWVVVASNSASGQSTVSASIATVVTNITALALRWSGTTDANWAGHPNTAAANGLQAY
jgi:hypothetical protein